MKFKKFLKTIIYYITVIFLKIVSFLFRHNNKNNQIQLANKIINKFFYNKFNFDKIRTFLYLHEINKKNLKLHFTQKIFEKEFVDFLFSSKNSDDYTKDKYLSEDKIKISGIDFFHLNSKKDAKTINNEISIRNEYNIDFQCSNPVILDIGSNYGHFAIHMLINYPEADIYCFEPNPYAVSVIKKNIQNFKSSKIKVNCFAVSNKNETVKIKVPKKMPMAANIINNKKYSEAECIEKTVECKKISENLPEKKIDLIKIDAEGSEKDILSDLENHFEQIDRIVIEYHFIDKKYDLINLHTIYKSLIKGKFFISGNINLERNSNVFQHLDKRKSFLIYAKK